MNSINPGKTENYSRENYDRTIYACFMAYVVQAIVNNFAPLLFLTFQKEFGIPLSQITMLITFNFGIQLLVDLVSPLFIDRIGYRASMLMADAMAAAGLVLLTVLPGIMPDPFPGLLLAVMIYAVGGGLLEVLVSPIVEACPTKHKEAAMSLLHSFYCWGQVAVVLLSTIFFTILGIGNWRIMAVIWAAVPLLNLIIFTRVPIASLIAEGEKGLKAGQLFRKKVFWILMVMMLCAGASEQAVSQWASTFAEQGLGVSKTLGDLMGPMFFALMMGTSRAIYGKYGSRIPLEKFMGFSAALCIGSYLILSFVPNPVIALLGCGLCGFSVGIFWPGTFSLASASIRNGGTLMFAMFALAGDIGCSGGPTFAGMIAAASGDDLRKGICAAILFPAVMAVCLAIRKFRRDAG